MHLPISKPITSNYQGDGVVEIQMSVLEAITAYLTTKHTYHLDV